MFGNFGKMVAEGTALALACGTSPIGAGLCVAFGAGELEAGDPSGSKFVVAGTGRLFFGKSGRSTANGRAASGEAATVGEDISATALRSASRPARVGSNDSRALQALKKKVDRGDQAFSGVPKSQSAANDIIRQVIGAQNKIIRERVRDGRVVQDIFDPATGRGVRIVDGDFDTFLNL